MWDWCGRQNYFTRAISTCWNPQRSTLAASRSGLESWTNFIFCRHDSLPLTLLLYPWPATLNTTQVAFLTTVRYFSLKAYLDTPNFPSFLWQITPEVGVSSATKPIKITTSLTATVGLQHNLTQLVVLKWMPRLGVSPCVGGSRRPSLIMWLRPPRENGNPRQEVVLENPALYYSAVKKDKQNLRKKVVRHADVKWLWLWWRMGWTTVLRVCGVVFLCNDTSPEWWDPILTSEKTR